jgi:uncharacterized membrane protein YhfC
MNILSITHPLNGIIMILLGVGLGIFIASRYRLGWRIWWIGVFTFIISQVGHLPFNSLVINPIINYQVARLPDGWQLPSIAILLGISAGLFEEFSRYCVYRWWIIDARTWSQGILFGAGHGGFEAIILGIISLYAFVQLIAIKNIDLSTIVSADQISLARQQIDMYWSMPWYDSLIGALERVFALPLHVAASVLVLQAFIRNQFRWVWFAVGLHAFLNAVAVYISQTTGIYAAELAIGILAIFEIGVIFWLRQPQAQALPEPSINGILPIPSFPTQDIAETPENLDNTRFQ